MEKTALKNKRSVTPRSEKSAAASARHAPGKSAAPSDDYRPSQLVLVDGSSYLYRAFHAMPQLSNSRGEPTGAVYGVTNMLRKLLADYNPQYIAMVFDAPGKTFRDDIYPQYKATRAAMPDELGAQVATIYAIVEAMGLPLLQIEHVEADDVIGTLARQAAQSGMATLISTSDKDMAQLVEGHVTLVNTMTDSRYDRAGVMGKFGVPPERIVDYLALIGDTIDNIPGVVGVGPKTAAKWLQQYGSLDAIVECAADIPGKVGDNLRAALKQLPLARELATIRCDVPLECGPTDLRRRAPDDERLRELFTRLEFKNWLAELGGLNRPVAQLAPDTTQYELIFEPNQLDTWIERLTRSALFSFDTETTNLNPVGAELIGITFSDGAGVGAYIPLAHAYPGVPAQLNREMVLARLKPLLESTAAQKIGHHLKFDMSVLANYGIALAGIASDTMLESYVLDSTASRHDLDSLAIKYLGHKTIKYEEVTGKGKARINFSEVALDKALAYAAEDADMILRLHQVLWPKISEHPELAKLLTETELPLLTVLSRMERHGVRIDTTLLREQGTELATRMAALEEEAYSLGGQPFNLDSPKQIQEILFQKLGLPVLKKTPTGQPSTGEDVLQELALDYPLPRLILEYRGLSKLKSTYTDKLPEMISPSTGRVHTCYHQAVAATGRLSSSDPNLQNIPIRNPEGRRVRQAFIAEPGFKLISADYSQIELRIMAHLSGDIGLIKAFADKQDVHRVTAAEVFGVSAERVSADMRRHAKAINFGLIYGMSAFGLARQLRIDRAAAQEHVDRYFARYPGVKSFMDRTREQARTAGYVETLFGRRLYLPEINAPNATRRQATERAAINAPMQGTAADLIKRAMIEVDRRIRTLGPSIRMIMQVHDELVFEAQDDMVAPAIELIRDCMENVANLAVPLVVDIGAGANWDEAH